MLRDTAEARLHRFTQMPWVRGTAGEYETLTARRDPWALYCFWRRGLPLVPAPRAGYLAVFVVLRGSADGSVSPDSDEYVAEFAALPHASACVAIQLASLV